MDALVERVTLRIAEAIHPDKIILFGSRAKGTATEESDIDLVVDCAPETGAFFSLN